jgi:hypothetical protein
MTLWSVGSFVHNNEHKAKKKIQVRVHVLSNDEVVSTEYNGVL